jgi:hypothetical protein
MLGRGAIVTEFKPIYVHISVFALGVTCSRFGPSVRLTTLVCDTGKLHSFLSFFPIPSLVVPTYFDRQFSGSTSGILGSGTWCLFDPWIRDPGWVKKSGSGSRIKYLNSLMRIRDGKNSDQAWKMSDMGSGINIPDPQHCLQK